MGLHQAITIAPDREAFRKEAQLLRGCYLDAFSRLETSVMQFAERLQLKIQPNAPFGQKMQALKKARDQFRHPSKLEDRLAAIARCAAMRADIVHSILAVAFIWDGRDERMMLMFQNVGDALRPPLLMTIQDLQKNISQLNQLAHQFSQQQLKAPAPAASAASSD